MHEYVPIDYDAQSAKRLRQIPKEKAIALLAQDLIEDYSGIKFNLEHFDVKVARVESRTSENPNGPQRFMLVIDAREPRKEK